MRALIDAHKERLRATDAGMEVITPGGVGLTEAIAEHEAEKALGVPLRQTTEPIEMQVYLYLGGAKPAGLCVVLDEDNYASAIAQMALIFTNHVKKELTKGEP